MITARARKRTRTRVCVSIPRECSRSLSEKVRSYINRAKYKSIFARVTSSYRRRRRGRKFRVDDGNGESCSIDFHSVRFSRGVYIGEINMRDVTTCTNLNFRVFSVGAVKFHELDTHRACSRALCIRCIFDVPVIAAMSGEIPKYINKTFRVLCVLEQIRSA